LDIKDFRALRVSLASPEQILSWSHGEVTKPETINYRRLRPERDGLFCEAIFGPTKDWQCYCGKYKKIRHKGIVCEKCGVEVTRSRVRRERMGHIRLASPVAHVWYTQRVPSYLGLLLDISRRDLDRVLYFAQYMITDIDEEARSKVYRRLDEKLAGEMAGLRNSLKEQVEKIEAEIGGKIEKLEARAERIKQKYDEALAEETDRIMEEASAVQTRLSRAMGKIIRKDIEFGPSGTLLVSSGSTVKREHLAGLNRAVQGQIEEVEGAIREKQRGELVVIEAEIDLLRQEMEGKTRELNQEVDAQIGELKAGAEEKRREIKAVKVKQFLNETQYRELETEWGRFFSAEMGGDALYRVCKGLDLDQMAERLRREANESRSKQRRKKATKRLRVVEALRKSSNRPEWMILTILPVIPPDLRPMVQLDGGRFATSDLNDLYRRVINRNNRLKKLVELGAPDVIVRNEKRMLQEAVDSLIDNSRRGKAISSRGRRKLKSLSDMLKGKQGRFRRNLLGKRVDYSGRSVIVIGPHLKLHQCGLPKSMALELFKPFVMQRLVEHSYAHNVKGTRRIIEQMRPEVWEVLDEVVKDHLVLLNRAPTLHRLGIQAFEPVLVEGNAIQIHPLVCSAFNADFDGDQMAVHVPLSEAAQKEARELMLSSRNLLLPSSGEPTVSPTKDIVLGCYYLTVEEDGCKGEGKVFADIDEVTLAYELGQVDLHAKIKLRAKVLVTKRRLTRLIDTTVGRAIFNSALPEELRYRNEEMDKGKLRQLVAECYHKLGPEATATMVDEIKELGFRYATQSGLTIAVSDITIPEEKERILKEVSAEAEDIDRQYRRGLITENEQYVKKVELWTEAMDEVTEAVAEALDPMGSIRLMAASGSTKGGFQPVRQLAGMRGLMADPSGRIIELPIRSNFREGLTALEYFISTHGARKGLADTALRTADAGYLTRRLVDVAQDSIVNAEDCGTENGVWIRAGRSEEIGESLEERVWGRVAASDILHPETGQVIVEKGEMISRAHLVEIEEAGVQEAFVRSPLTCELRYGVCKKCYGRDLAREGLVRLGEAVGIVAAQSIGEPGTQLTLRTFHTGGVVEGEHRDITHGLPRVQELFEARSPKGQAIIADMDGNVQILHEDGMRKIVLTATDVFREEHEIPLGYRLIVEDGDEIEKGAVLAQRGTQGSARFGQVTAGTEGRVIRDDKRITVYREEQIRTEYEVASNARLHVRNLQEVVAGEQLTEGPLNPHEVLRIQGGEAVQIYLLEEIQRVYRSQGVTINDKHIEMIVRQMLSKVLITSPGDTDFMLGETVERLAFEEANRRVMEDGGGPATARQVLLGITKAALSTESFLSASSFQHTINVLAQAAIEGRRDELRGLKENVIIGKLIPAGTGFQSEEKEKEVQAEFEGEEEGAIAELEFDEEEEGVVAEPELAATQ
jgi:DNA-directed RNA polymerase subunit beta'